MPDQRLGRIEPEDEEERCPDEPRLPEPDTRDVTDAPDPAEGHDVIGGDRRAPDRRDPGLLDDDVCAEVGRRGAVLVAQPLRGTDQEQVRGDAGRDS